MRGNAVELQRIASELAGKLVLDAELQTEVWAALRADVFELWEDRALVSRLASHFERVKRLSRTVTEQAYRELGRSGAPPRGASAARVTEVEARVAEEAASRARGAAETALQLASELEPLTRASITER